MVICLVAMVVFGIMGIFSARYRSIAKESFDCVFRMITLRPCQTGFDQKVKAKVTSKLMKKSERLAGLFYRNFKLISILFTLLFFGSLFYTGYSVYNLAVYGTCDPTNPGECVFNPQASSCGGTNCQDQCLCGAETCKSPDYIACNGDCDCQSSVCGMGS